MIVLVIGTPNSGKSIHGENLAMKLAVGKKKAYLATMIPFGVDGQKRIEKHRLMRKGKGFLTLEKATDINELVTELRENEIHTVLLECMSNLIGNEMYEKKHVKKTQLELRDYICRETMELAKQVEHCVVITNEFPLEDDGYDEETRAYVTLVHMVNEELKKYVDAYEVLEEKNWVRYETGKEFM